MELVNTNIPSSLLSFFSLLVSDSLILSIIFSIFQAVNVFVRLSEDAMDPSGSLEDDFEDKEGDSGS